MFDLMLTGVNSPRSIWLQARNDWNLTSKAGRKIAVSTVYRIFNDPFYYGEYEYPKGSGTWIKGKHHPMITQKEFTQIQILLGKKSLPRSKSHDFSFRGPITCGECGAMVTAESKVKKQKNGNVHFYTYYHCTKKKKPDCSQRSIEEGELHRQISKVLSEIVLPNDFCEWALGVLKSNSIVEAQGRNLILGNQRTEYDKVLKKGVLRVNDFATPDMATRGSGRPIILAAHRFGYIEWTQTYRLKNSFYKLPDLKPGDEVEIVWNQHRYKYQVTKLEEGERITDYSSDLIMYTCKYLVSPIRIFVYAKLMI
jgi:predicted metal-binding protein